MQCKLYMGVGGERERKKLRPLRQENSFTLSTESFLLLGCVGRMQINPDDSDAELCLRCVRPSAC